MTVGLPLMKNVLAQLNKSAAAASAVNAGIHKKILGLGATTLTVSNNEMRDIMEIVDSIENFGLLIQGVTQAVENETKEHRGRYLGVLLVTLGASLLENMLSDKGEIRVGDGVISWTGFLMSPHPLTNFEKQNY